MVAVSSEVGVVERERPSAALERVVRERFGEALIEVREFRGETTLVVTKAIILELLAFLRAEPAWRFDRLADLTAVDYLDLGGASRFAVVYHVMARASLQRLRVRALVDENDPVIASVVPLFPVANWFEREVYDLFGIKFVGHPNLTRILMPDDWDGHPLRKDFPVGMEEVAFSFNSDSRGGLALRDVAAASTAAYADRGPGGDRLKAHSISLP